MVSGFLTSPCDHCRMSSAVARPMRSSSKKLTSSTSAIPRISIARLWFRRSGARAAAHAAARASRSDFVDADHAFVGTPGGAEAQLLARPEDLVVRLTHLQCHPIAGEHLHVEAERLQLLEQNL